MVRDLRGTGTLVPQSIYSVSAPVEGQVYRLVQTPGARVNADTVLVELANPALEQAVTEAQWQVRQAEGEMESQGASLEVELLGVQSSLAKMESENERAQTEARLNQELYKHGLVARVELEGSEVIAREYRNRLTLERQASSGSPGGPAQATGGLPGEAGTSKGEPGPETATGRCHKGHGRTGGGPGAGQRPSGRARSARNVIGTSQRSHAPKGGTESP